jgi:hypothetical protein
LLGISLTLLIASIWWTRIECKRFHIRTRKSELREKMIFKNSDLSRLFPQGLHGPDDATPQLTGSKCIHCKQEILNSFYAVACKTCDQPVHKDCRKDHRRDAHAKAPSGPSLPRRSPR